MADRMRVTSLMVLLPSPVAPLPSPSDQISGTFPPFPDAPAVGEISVVFQLHAIVGVPVPKSDRPGQEGQEDRDGQDGRRSRTPPPPLPDPLQDTRRTGPHRLARHKTMKGLRHS